MFRLIKGEMIKIFHKKSFYIITILYLLFTILTNYIYKDMDNYNDSLEKVNIVELENENKNLDLTKEEDIEKYINNKTIIELKEISSKYSSSNQEYLINNYLRPIINELNRINYKTKDERKEELILQKEDFLEKIINNDWQYFVNLDISKLKNRQANTQDETILKRLDIYLKLAQYRIANNVDFKNNYLDKALRETEENLVEYQTLRQKANLTKEEKNRLDNLESMYLKNEYILKEKKDINNNETLRAVLINFSSEYELFILIYIILICGSIVSEEFNKGTIKYLLTKPFKRKTILTSKLLTVLILIPLIIIFMVISEIIIGGLMLGFASLKIPILIYKASSHSLVSYNIIKYLVLILLAKSPMYLTLICLCFSLSTVTLSTSSAVSLTFLFYFISEVIKNLVLTYKIKFLAYFVSIHWDFTYIIKEQLNPFKYSWQTSALIVSTYIGIIICLIYIYFTKKDVKNI